MHFLYILYVIYAYTHLCI